jgi:hypothetical protein
LNNLNEKGWSITNRLGKQLQEDTLVIGISQDSKLFQLGVLLRLWMESIDVSQSSNYIWKVENEYQENETYRQLIPKAFWQFAVVSITRFCHEFKSK